MLIMLGCAESKPDPRVTSVEFRQVGCYGSCPVFEVSVNEDGQASYRGHEYVAVKGERRFDVTAEQYRAFLGKLEPYRRDARPFVEEKLDEIVQGPTCPPGVPEWTDDAGAFVRWRGPEVDVYSSYYFGCDGDRKRAFYESLEEAVFELPVRSFVGVAR